MSKKILIDATHKEETRAAMIDGGQLQDYELETITKKENRSNIYLAKVIRVEPSLQAAFLDYGGARHGFLPFAEIHPDYFQIPVEDKKALLATSSDGGETGEDGEPEIETFAEDDDGSTSRSRGSDSRKELLKKYKIQEVIKAGQIMLVQVDKDERGNKGAAITTFISIAGMSGVLMPNSNKRVRFGVSRKIPYGDARRQIKDVLKELPIPDGMTIIARTSAIGKSKDEMMRDYDYMTELWNEIRRKTFASVAPALIHEDGNLLKRAIRDMYRDDIDEILIEGDEGYGEASTFARAIGFDAPQKIVRYSKKTPLFIEYDVEEQLESVGSPVVKLPSGGYIVINPTEALTAIDVNSGKSTRERDIEETAYQTNLEAAMEIGRQLRLRDMGGLVVVDFIDMIEPKHIQLVEEKMRSAIKRDRAKIQMAKLSQFGLMEVSRQRLRPSVLEVSHKPCPYCGGTGFMPSVQTASLGLLRHIEEALSTRHSARIYAAVHPDIAFYVLNQKREDIAEMEERYKTSIIINGDESVLNEKSVLIDRLNYDAKLGGYFKEQEPQGGRRRQDPARADNARLVKQSGNPPPQPREGGGQPQNRRSRGPQNNGDRPDRNDRPGGDRGDRAPAKKKGVLAKLFG